MIPWLSILLWLPMLAAIVIIALPTEQPKVFRGIAVGTGLIMLGISIALTWMGAGIGKSGVNSRSVLSTNSGCTAAIRPQISSRAATSMKR